MRTLFASIALGLLLTAVAATSIAEEAVADGAEIREDETKRLWIDETLSAFVDARARRDELSLNLVDDRVSGYLAAQTAESTREAPRDLRHGIWDAGVEITQKEQLTAIHIEWGELHGVKDHESLERKETLLRELVGIARGEIPQDETESAQEEEEQAREDRRES